VHSPAVRSLLTDDALGAFMLSPSQLAHDRPETTELSFHVNPDRLLSTHEFADAPAPAAAIEAVAGTPDSFDRKVNFDHHFDVLRPFCDCAAKQVLVATEAGLWSFLTSGGYAGQLHVYLARVDEDVALAVALLGQPELVANPAVRRLVQLEDALDRSGGVGCGDASRDELGRIAWINEPYHRRRGRGGLSGSGEALVVVSEIVDRVGALADGCSSTLPLVGDFDVVLRSGRVAVVTERGPYARLGYRRAGIDVYMAVRVEDGRKVVTVGLTSVFVPLDLGAVYARLNLLEGARDGEGWGGSSHIGGSPFTGTSLDIEDIFAVVASMFLAGKRAGSAEAVG